MPKMNGTGPEGQGPGTGRGLGKCKEVSKNDKEKKPSYKSKRPQR